MGLIYKLTSPDKKSYIGQTIKTFEKRMSSHKWASSKLDKLDGCRYLNNAIRLHGWDNFTKEIIHECDEELLDAKEKECIEHYNTLAPNGYNLMIGGNSNKHYSEETKQKMREIALARDTTCYRKSEATKDFPKYIGLFNGYPRISKHPKCRSKSFADKTITFEQNLENAKKFLDQLNAGEVEVIIEKSDRPQGVQVTKNGYRIYTKGADGKMIIKMFTKQSESMELKYQNVMNYYNELKTSGRILNNKINDKINE